MDMYELVGPEVTAGYFIRCRYDFLFRMDGQVLSLKFHQIFSDIQAWWHLDSAIAPSVVYRCHIRPS